MKLPRLATSLVGLLLAGAVLTSFGCSLDTNGIATLPDCPSLSDVHVSVQGSVREYKYTANCGYAGNFKVDGTFDTSGYKVQESVTQLGANGPSGGSSSQCSGDPWSTPSVCILKSTSGNLPQVRGLYAWEFPLSAYVLHYAQRVQLGNALTAAQNASVDPEINVDPGALGGIAYIVPCSTSDTKGLQILSPSDGADATAGLLLKIARADAACNSAGQEYDLQWQGMNYIDFAWQPVAVQQQFDGADNPNGETLAPANFGFLSSGCLCVTFKVRARLHGDDAAPWTDWVSFVV